MSCGHGQVHYRVVDVPVEFRGVTANATVQLMLCLDCRGAFAINEEGLVDYSPDAPQR